MGKIITMPHVEEKKEKEKVSTSEIIMDFIQKYRKILGITLLSCIAVLVCIIAGFGIRDFLNSKAISTVEALNDRYETLKIDINEPSKVEDVQALLQELQEFAQKTGAYSGARAYSIIASIQMDQKNWTDAENSWIAAASKTPKIYLAPIAFFNAGVAAEETGNNEYALAHYQKALEYADQFPGAARTQFTIGRIQEVLHNKEAALEAYRKVRDFEEKQAPQGQIWTNLAHSRIITLTGLDSAD